ncbi:GNAT family N-acetyltransferase [Rhizobium sp. BK251]|uniref:GNAT family N-acetyltransferase n=1 Tax=Rhizobium sp. BK251 TaxID=2512125 RepID=UPI00104C413C|nr:GNAT family N-acetyltransferase [Rhizobium sp. BK251]TCL70335.1 CelD/BcsL family acetyltransferase involved in cellulose biosynthesis [Rhizobium sp. BK251]
MQTQTLDDRPLQGGQAKEPPPLHVVENKATEELQLSRLSAMEPLEAEWRRLEEDDRNSLHQGYDWCAAWTKNQGSELAILWGRIGERTAFILPLEVRRTGAGRVARFIATEHSNINTGLFDRDFLDAADHSVLAALPGRIAAALDGVADILLLQKVPLEWRRRQNPLCALPHFPNQNRAYQLPLLEGFEETLKQINAKSRRKKFRVQERRFEAVGGYEHVVASTPQEQHALLEILFRQKAVRFRTLGLPDVFDEADVRAFFHQMLDSATPGHDAYPLRLHALRVGTPEEGRIAAVAALSRKGDHVICQFSAFDDTVVPDTSPGEMLFHLMISHLHGQGVALFDFGIGYQPYKRSWCPVETVHYDLAMPLTARGRLAALLQRAGTRAKIFIKAHPGLYGFLQRIRAGSRNAPAALGEDTET